MSDLTRHTILQRRPELDLHLDAGGKMRIDLGSRSVTCDERALKILAEFSRPRPLAVALASLERQVTGAADWRDLMATVVRLHDAGVLSSDIESPPPVAKSPASYDAAPVHIRMLGDRVRTESFLAAIREVVRPGDAVVDLGTGTGVLAIAAAKAGARHVYAIEESGIADSARALFEANGCGDLITLVAGRSTAVDLPERCDVLVSEMIGNDPLGEDILSVTADAVGRFLEPGGRLIPSRVELFGLPVTVPRAKLAENLFEAAPLDAWRSWYGVDFGPLGELKTNRPRGFLVAPVTAREWPVLSAAVPLVEADLRTARGSVFRRTSRATAVIDGELNGVLAYFETDLAPGVRLSTHPASVRSDNHWHSPVWLLDEGVPLEAGDPFVVTYRREAMADPGTIRVSRSAAGESLDDAE